MAADMDIPIACISRCTPMARTGWRTRGPARTCRGICCGTARPWRTTRRGSIGLEHSSGARTLKAFLSFDGELLRAEGPGRPKNGKRETFYVVRGRGRNVRFVTVLEPVGDAPKVQTVRVQGSVIEIQTAQGVDRHTATVAGWEITAATGARIRLAAERPRQQPLEPHAELDTPHPPGGA